MTDPTHRVGDADQNRELFLVGDLHLDHEAVLEYTDRPFASVAEMNRRLVDGWNAVVDPGDEVVFLGDLAVPSQPTTVRRWLGRLQGDVVFVAGDHDDAVGATGAVAPRAAYRFEAGGHRFYCVHDPAEASRVRSGGQPADDAPPADDPSPADGEWLVHGHHHDRRPERFPFVEPEARRVNVSVELLGYEPIPVSELIGYLEDGRRLLIRPDREDGE